MHVIFTKAHRGKEVKMEQLKLPFKGKSKIYRKLPMTYNEWLKHIRQAEMTAGITTGRVRSSNSVRIRRRPVRSNAVER